MAVSLSSFYVAIKPDVTDCPNIAIDNALIGAAIDFCQRTHIWQQEFSLGQTVINTSDYQVTGLPAGSEIHVIRDVYCYSSRIFPVGSYTLRDSPTWRTETGTPTYFKFTYPDTIKLIPKPSTASIDNLIVIAALKPTRAATSLPDIMGQPYYDAIAHGALSRLFARKGMPWFNAGMSDHHKSIFNEAITTAKRDMFTGSNNSSIDITPSFFA